MSRTKAEKRALKLAAEENARKKEVDEFYTSPRLPYGLTRDDFYITPCEYCKIVGFNGTYITNACFHGPDGSGACAPCAVRIGWIQKTPGIKVFSNFTEYCDAVRASARNY